MFFKWFFLIERPQAYDSASGLHISVVLPLIYQFTNIFVKSSHLYFTDDLLFPPACSVVTIVPCSTTVQPATRTPLLAAEVGRATYWTRWATRAEPATHGILVTTCSSTTTLTLLWTACIHSTTLSWWIAVEEPTFRVQYTQLLTHQISKYMHDIVKKYLKNLAFDFCRFFSSMTSDFKRIFYPRFYPLYLFSYLNSWERASISLFNVFCLLDVQC